MFGVRICGIYCKPLNSAVDATPKTPGFSCRLFGSDECAELIAGTSRPELELSERFIRLALAKGDVCAAIISKDEIVAYIWFALTPTHYGEGVHIGVQEDSLYCYKAFVLPTFRGRNLPATFNILIDRYCRAHGAKHTIAYIDLHNLASISAMTAHGNGRRIGFAGYLKRGPVILTFRTAGVRQHGVRFFLPGQVAENETQYAAPYPGTGTGTRGDLNTPPWLGRASSLPTQARPKE